MRYPPDPPAETGIPGGVVLFALISFLIVQIFSEKVQNVANYLKILFQKIWRTYFTSEKDYFDFSKKDFAFLLDFGRRKCLENISWKNCKNKLETIQSDFECSETYSFDRITFRFFKFSTWYAKTLVNRCWPNCVSSP